MNIELQYMYIMDSITTTNSRVEQTNTVNLLNKIALAKELLAAAHLLACCTLCNYFFRVVSNCIKIMNIDYMNIMDYIFRVQ